MRRLVHGQIFLAGYIHTTHKHFFHDDAEGVFLIASISKSDLFRSRLNDKTAPHFVYFVSISIVQNGIETPLILSY